MALKKCDCLLCSFENPKPTATAIIIEKEKLLVVKRVQEPFKGKRDFVGGYLNKDETPEDGLRREIKEELGVDCLLHYVSTFNGTASYGGYVYPIVNFAYLVQLKGRIKLDKRENSRVSWVAIKALKTIAFDSNQKILRYVKENFVYDIARVRKLVGQLDQSAHVDEQSLYKALLGMGWIFPRQTLLRKQAVVEDMIVDDKERGKGYGEKILLDLIDWAKSQGVEVVELTTNPKRIAANGLYQKVGFKLHETNHYLLKL
jgi:ADP-ribose pyrophosphatase YjhB (NUDIX family)